MWRATVPQLGEAVRIAAGLDNPLYFDATAPAGEPQYYWVRAVNNRGSSTFSTGDTGLRDNPAGLPVITSHPTGTTVSYGSAISLYVSVTSNTPVTYAWRKNGVALSNGVTTANYFLPVNSATISDAGDYDVIVSNNAGSVVSRAARISVAKGTQSITLTNLENMVFTPNPITITAGASPSKLPVLIELVSGPATLSGTSLLLTGLGRVTLRATQAGDDRYFAAAPVTEIFDVAPAPVTIGLSGLLTSYDGNPHPVNVSGTPPGVSVRVTYSGASTPPTAAGSYQVMAEVQSPVYFGANAESRQSYPLRKASHSQRRLGFWRRPVPCSFRQPPVRGCRWSSISFPVLLP
ncbi:MAG: immunoglobulin domain-containing protein [Opitutaceae bacterium]|nr:immunoglobulin domain-containing protein [Opitutaceae bacterium]